MYRALFCLTRIVVSVVFPLVVFQVLDLIGIVINFLSLIVFPTKAAHVAFRGVAGHDPLARGYHTTTDWVSGVSGLGIGIQSVGVSIPGSGLRIQDLGFRV